VVIEEREFVIDIDTFHLSTVRNIEQLNNNTPVNTEVLWGCGGEVSWAVRETPIGNHSANRWSPGFFAEQIDKCRSARIALNAADVYDARRRCQGGPSLREQE